jgi:hypothetical protein
LQKFETTKLFYGKYLYKLQLTNSIGRIFRDKNLSYAREVLDSLQLQYEQGEPLRLTFWLREQVVTEQSFLDARKLFKFLSKIDDYTLRIQSNTINVYSNNREWLHTLKSAINKNFVNEMWEPNPKSISHLNANTIIVDKDNGYQYKVTLGPGLSDTVGFAAWSLNNQEKVKVGPVLLDALRDNQWVSDMYFYARDEKILQLCTLMLSNIRRVDKLVVKANIDK